MVEEAHNTPVQQATYIKPAAATPSAVVRSPASRPGCCATTGPTPGRTGQPEAARYAAAVHGSGIAVRATNKYPNESVDVAFNPIGQVVGQFTKVEKSAAVIERWVQEYLERRTGSTN